MTKSAAILALLLAAAGAPTAAAQAPAAPQASAAGRFDVGGGFTLAVPASTDGESLFAWPLASAHAGVALTPRLALEGVFDVHPQPHDVTTFYRAQVRWRLCGAAPGGLTTHLTAGGTGWFSYESQPEYRWRDADGHEEVFPAQSVLERRAARLSRDRCRVAETARRAPGAPGRRRGGHRALRRRGDGAAAADNRRDVSHRTPARRALAVGAARPTGRARRFACSKTSPAMETSASFGDSPAGRCLARYLVVRRHPDDLDGP